MRKYVEPEVFEYIDGDTIFKTTDKELAVIVFEYGKKKTANDFDMIKKDYVKELDADIKRLKKEIKDQDDK